MTYPDIKDSHVCMKTYIIFIQEHVELPNTYPQVRLVEFVRNVPTQRTKRSPLLNDGVEKAQTIQHLLELSLKEKVNTAHENVATWKRAQRFTAVFI